MLHSKKEDFGETTEAYAMPFNLTSQVWTPWAPNFPDACRADPIDGSAVLASESMEYGIHLSNPNKYSKEVSQLASQTIIGESESLPGAATVKKCHSFLCLKLLKRSLLLGKKTRRSWSSRGLKSLYDFGILYIIYIYICKHIYIYISSTYVLHLFNVVHILWFDQVSLQVSSQLGVENTLHSLPPVLPVCSSLLESWQGKVPTFSQATSPHRFAQRNHKICKFGNEPRNNYLI